MPEIENLAYHLHFYAAKENLETPLHTNCPVIYLELEGNLLTVSVGAYDGISSMKDAVVSVELQSTKVNMPHLETQASIWYALKEGVQALQKEFEEEMKRKPQGIRHFPWIQEVKKPKSVDKITFQYDGYLDKDMNKRFLFVAHVVGTERKLLVKFENRPYPVELHLKLEEKGFAPELLGYESFDPWWHVVVMEHLGNNEEAQHLDEVDITDEIRAKVEAGVKTIHEAGFVHGDLRGPNILVKGDNIYILDLEWAEKETKAVYPFDLNPEVFGEAHEEQGIKPGAVIKKEHDWWMVNRLLNLQ